MLLEEHARTFAAEFLNYACGRWSGGRDENDPVYRVVTESRDVGAAQKSYSSCGDLAHWLLFRMGCRSDFVNRQEHHGYKIGRNISSLAGCSLAEDAKPEDVYQTGDVLIIWSRPDTSDAHVMVVLEHQPPRLVSAEYGQPGGAVRDRSLVKAGQVGQRQIQRVLRLMRVLTDAEQHQQLKEPDYTALPLAQAYAAQSAGVANGSAPTASP
ncbi:MAG: hypothetical protein QM756_14650 [Polyangiaceae bacterium]